MDLPEIALWIIGLLIAFLLGWLTNWYFYRKQSKESKAAIDILKVLEQYMNAEIRLGDDKRGKIVRNPDGTIAIAWHVNLSETLSVSDKVGKKKKEPQTK